jgi:hypothetical protein
MIGASLSKGSRHLRASWQALLNSLNKYMKLIYILLSICFLLSCNGQEPKEKTSSAESLQFVMQPSVGEIIKTDFIQNDAKYLIQPDSCFFLSFIRDKYADTLVLNSFRVIKGLKFYNDECPYTMFGYSIIQNTQTSEWFYYGQPDVYTMMFSSNLIEGKIVEFENNSLNILVNRLLKSNFNHEEVDGLLYNLYFRNFENLLYSNRPFFLRTQSIYDILEEYDIPKLNKEIIEREFKNFPKRQFFVFENQYLGIIIFRYHFTETNDIVIKEFLLPPLKRVKQFRSDAFPKDCNN